SLKSGHGVSEADKTARHQARKENFNDKLLTGISYSLSILLTVYPNMTIFYGQAKYVPNSFFDEYLAKPGTKASKFLYSYAAWSGSTFNVLLAVYGAAVAVPKLWELLVSVYDELKKGNRANAFKILTVDLGMSCLAAYEATLIYYNLQDVFFEHNPNWPSYGNGGVFAGIVLLNFTGAVGVVQGLAYWAKRKPYVTAAQLLLADTSTTKRDLILGVVRAEVQRGIIQELNVVVETLAERVPMMASRSVALIEIFDNLAGGKPDLNKFLDQLVKYTGALDPSLVESKKFRGTKYVVLFVIMLALLGFIAGTFITRGLLSGMGAFLGNFGLGLRMASGTAYDLLFSGLFGPSVMFSWWTLGPGTVALILALTGTSWASMAQLTQNLPAVKNNLVYLITAVVINAFGTGIFNFLGYQGLQDIVAKSIAIKKFKATWVQEGDGIKARLDAGESLNSTDKNLLKAALVDFYGALKTSLGKKTATEFNDILRKMLSGLTPDMAMTKTIGKVFGALGMLGGHGENLTPITALRTYLGYADPANEGDEVLLSEEKIKQQQWELANTKLNNPVKTDLYGGAAVPKGQGGGAYDKKVAWAYVRQHTKEFFWRWGLYAAAATSAYLFMDYDSWVSSAVVGVAATLTSLPRDFCQLVSNSFHGQGEYAAVRRADDPEEADPPEVVIHQPAATEAGADDDDHDHNDDKKVAVSAPPAAATSTMDGAGPLAHKQPKRCQALRNCAATAFHGIYAAIGTVLGNPLVQTAAAMALMTGATKYFQHVDENFAHWEQGCVLVTLGVTASWMVKSALPSVPTTAGDRHLGLPSHTVPVATA
ncbi:MAG: hypothetical protein K0U12_01430, partial [Gammaproteobacteria bacterium]|nr:hypothetical protein [Gammaproteobacteria bacterium]